MKMLWFMWLGDDCLKTDERYNPETNGLNEQTSTLVGFVRVLVSLMERSTLLEGEWFEC